MNTIADAYSAYCIKRFGLPTEDEVAALEARIGVQLPADYRRFLLEYNGGVFREPVILPVASGCPEDCLTFLNGIGGGATIDCAEFASESDLALFDDNDPPEVIPAGHTMMGNLILLITHPEDFGCLVLKKAFSDESFFLADRIEEFFALLREPDED